MKSNRLFPQLALQISRSCLIAMLYSLILLLKGTPQLTVPLQLVCYSAAIVLIDRAFIRKSRTVFQIVVLNAVCGLAMFGQLLLTSCFPLLWQGIYGFLAIVILTAAGAAGVYGSVKLNSILLSMDGNILLLVFSVLVMLSLPHPLTWVLFSAVGAFAGFMGSVSFRMNRFPGRREWGILLFLLAVIAAAAWLLFSFVISPLSTGAAGLGQGAAGAFVFLWKQISRFFSWLASLLPAEDGKAGVPDLEPAHISSVEEEAGSMQENGIMPLLVVGIVLAVIFVIVILVFKRTRKTKVNGRQVQGRRAEDAVRQMPLAEAFRKLLEKIRRRMVTRQYLAAKKNMPEGVYFRLKKICRHSRFREQPSDTPSFFLCRIQEGMSDPETVRRLEEVERQLEINFYARRPEEIAYPWAGALCAAVKRQIRAEKLLSREKKSSMPEVAEL